MGLDNSTRRYVERSIKTYLFCLHQTQDKILKIIMLLSRLSSAIIKFY
jgi:hypothetical protein